LSNIRVTYSGLISLVVGITSIFTGTIFTLIVTRTITPEEFGTWNLIGSLITYVVIVEPIISYWVTRETARGIESAKTAIFTSGIFSMCGVLGYIIIGYFVALNSDADQDIILFAVILVPVMFLNKTLTAINLGWKPQSASYGILAFEITKIPGALALVYFLDMGIFGAIVTTAIAYIASIIILIIYAKEKIKAKIQFSHIRKWMKLSWLPLYPSLSSMIFSLDVMIFSVITGSVVGLAYYSASMAIGMIVGQTGQIARAVYPKLLEGGNKNHFNENLMRFFYFSIPFTGLSLILAKPGLFALNPIYQIAVPVVIFLTLRTFVYTLSQLFEQANKGIDLVDTSEKSTFRDYLKSKLVLMPTIYLVKHTIYIISLIILVFLFISKPQIELVVYWSIMSFLVEIPFFLYLYKISKRHFEIKIQKEVIFKYIFSTVFVFGIIFILMEEFLVYDNSIFKFLPNVIFYGLLAAAGYLGMTYLLDIKTRNLFKAIYCEIRK